MNTKSKTLDTILATVGLTAVALIIILLVGGLVANATCPDYDCTPPTTEPTETTWPDTTTATTTTSSVPDSTSSTSTTSPASTTTVAASTSTSTAPTTVAPTSTSSTTMAPSTTGTPSTSTTSPTPTSISWATSPTTSVAVAPPPVPTRNLPNTGAGMWWKLAAAISLVSVGILLVMISRAPEYPSEAGTLDAFQSRIDRLQAFTFDARTEIGDNIKTSRQQVPDEEAKP